MKNRLITIFAIISFPFIVAADNAEQESTFLSVLNSKEIQWLNEHPNVKFTGDPNWLPYEAFDNNGKYIGIVAEHLILISKMSGLNFTKIPTKSWTESTEKAKQGLVDVLSETDDSDLKSHLNFTIPYITNPIVISMRNTENYVENINAIKDRKIALIKDYGYASKIRNKYPYINFITVNDIQDGLISVSTGKVDALLCTLALCSYTISEIGLNNVKITGKTEFDTKLAFGVQKNQPELLSILNKAISSIGRDQTQQILDGWIKSKFPQYVDYSLVYKVIGAALFLVVIFVIWVRRLSKEIESRIKTEEELKEAEESSRLSHQRLLLHREYSPLSVIEWNRDFEFLDWNPAAQKIFGYTKEEVLGRHITERILPESARPHVDKIWEDLIANKGGEYSLNENITKDGRTILCEWHNTPLVDDNGRVIGVTSLTEDITERKKSEDNIRQAQKMDAIGKLTGGIAHDFNNMLGVILGFTELLKEQVKNNEPIDIKFCDEILSAGDRAKTLTAKLLEFSRKGASDEETSDINEILNGMKNLLEKTLTHRIKIKYDLAESLWPVMLDKARMEDAILNLCINSMQAMPEGGNLILTTKNHHINSSDLNTENHSSNDYVYFSIEDNGLGMDEDTQQSIYEPFFTTKGTEGTGLGMSQVYGFVQQSHGEVNVSSEVGVGTKIEIIIPVTNEIQDPIHKDIDSHQSESPGGNGAILVVDDEPGLLEFMKQTLTKSGYSVSCAENAELALNILARKHIDLVITDVIMPGMNGYELALNISKLYPKIKLQIISGFSDESIIEEEQVFLHENRLHKPVSSSELLQKVKNILNED